MSLALEYLVDAIQAERTADRAHIRYVRDVRHVLARADNAVCPPARPSLAARILGRLRLRTPHNATSRTTG